ncbi:MAG TPA: tetratricopeptide repeat protein [Kofleriaceae bacterium]|jgi:tetratricopeptide (TPR) repeat protein
MRLSILAAGFTIAAAAVASAQPLRGPAPEEYQSDVKVDLPPVPQFDLPAGALSVKHLHVESKRFLGQHVVVHGFVTFAYDCVADVRKPGETERAAQKRVDDDPTLCERAKLYLGDTATTPHDQSLWVVDVPRPYNKLELTRMAKADRTMPDRCEPGEKDPAKQICPPYREGDEVVVAGTFALKSSHAEANSDGLLVYEAMRNVSRGWQTPGAKLELTQVTARPVAATLPPLAPLARPHPTPVTPDARARSLDYLANGNRALSGNRLDEARAAYKLAVDAWREDHLAWYALGMVELKAGHDADGVTALDRAVSLAPDEPMYQVFDGVAHYERDVQADPAATSFDVASEHLRRAVALDSHLWRAHYFLGRIARAQDRARETAAEFSAAIRENPREAGPYIALAELYRRWDYIDESMLVAQQGTANVTSSSALADLDDELGMGFEAKQRLPQAIEAYTHALDARADHPQARFQRGQAYFHSGDLVHAKRDLEDFVKARPADAFARTQATKMLMDLAAKRAHGR